MEKKQRFHHEDRRHYKFNKGYIQLMVKDHNGYNHGHDLSGYIYEHRLVMESHLGRRLGRAEVVHHIDGDRKNNVINNLLLFHSPKEHTAYHYSQEGKYNTNR